ncbi:cupin domain-containing protein [Pyramidobacter piscolens]|uniref:cupin domain-containing protein n=1 Tax=Pyramidobacter piscolens TaxID=638849 RepID=UPI0028EFF805|nr:cupin domain-containing protein [Pyramidobacter piscolens]
MEVKRGRLFDLSRRCASDGGELFDELAAGRGCRVERIVSVGQATPEGEWYDQDGDEWVALLQGEARLLWDNGDESPLAPGDWLLIPAHVRHRVVYTSAEPPCVWIAVHFRR